MLFLIAEITRIRNAGGYVEYGRVNGANQLKIRLYND